MLELVVELDRERTSVCESSAESGRFAIRPAAKLRRSGGGREHPGSAGAQLLTRGELGDR